jgi:phenylacetate-CoA ligase
MTDQALVAERATVLTRHETIGRLSWDRIRAASRIVSELADVAAPARPERLDELPVIGAAQILAMSRRVTRNGGALLMSSGGTTGQPKITYVAYRQALGRLRHEWWPLAPGNLLLNLFTPGRMWASHYYMQALAERSSADVIPAGPYSPAEIGDWLDTFNRLGVDAAAGNPTALADLAQGVLDAGGTLPLRKLIWMAEPWTAAKEETVRAAFPQAQFWGNYGSIENYVIATNTPACDLSTLHLMPDQLLELDDKGALLSRAGDGWTVPAIRYRLGDRIARAVCRCGREDALRVLGRADDAVKVYGTLVGVGEVLSNLAGQPGVDEAQLVLTPGRDGDRSVSRMTVQFSGTAVASQVLAELLRKFYDLGVVAHHYPDAIEARAVEQLTRVPRTNKVPPMIWLEGGDSA